MAEWLTIQDAGDKTFDHCFVVLNPLERDARTLNIIRTLLADGQSVCFVGLKSEDHSVLQGDQISIIEVPTKSTRFYRFWIDFQWKLYHHRNRIKARTYWAEDLYSLPITARLSQKHKGRLIYDSREIYSALGTIYHRPWRQAFFSGLEKHYIRQCDRIFTSGELDSEYLKDRYEVALPAVVMNIPHKRKVKKGNKIREYWGLSGGTKILLYQGLIGRGRGLLPVLESLPLLDDVVLCLLGDGGLVPRIKERARELEVENRLLHREWVPYDELLEWTASADAGLAFIEPVSLSYRFALPNKLFEYAMAETPALISNLPAMRKVLDEYQMGEILPPDATPEMMAAAIRKLMNPELRDRYLEACKKVANKYCWENQISVVRNL